MPRHHFEPHPLHSDCKHCHYQKDSTVHLHVEIPPNIMVLVTRDDDTEFLDIIPGGTDDLAVLGVYAWALHPLAKRIRWHDDELPNPIAPTASFWKST